VKEGDSDEEIDGVSQDFLPGSVKYDDEFEFEAEANSTLPLARCHPRERKATSEEEDGEDDVFDDDDSDDEVQVVGQSIPIQALTPAAQAISPMSTANRRSTATYAQALLPPTRTPAPPLATANQASKLPLSPPPCRHTFAPRLLALLL
jgi:hypothetical protein